MDDCIFFNNTKTLPVWETFCSGKNFAPVRGQLMSQFFHINWQLTLSPYMQDMTLAFRVSPFYLTLWHREGRRKEIQGETVFLSVNSLLHSFTLKNPAAPHTSLNSRALQMIPLSPSDLHNIHSCWCDASRIRISPQKNGNDESLQHCAVGKEDGGEGVLVGMLPPTHSRLQSLGPLLGL